METRTQLFIRALIVAILLLPSLGAVPPPGQIIVPIDECQLVDHFWEPNDYPAIDDKTTFTGAPSLGGVGITFDLNVVPAGSSWQVTWGDGPEYATEVGAEGKAFAYRGLQVYGSYPWSSTIVDPDGSTLEGLSGTLEVDADEMLDCSLDTLTGSPLPEITPTSPPEATETFAPTPELPDEPDVAAEEEPDSFIFRFFPEETSTVLLALCCCLSLGLLGAGTVIVIRLRRRGMSEVEIREPEED